MNKKICIHCEKSIKANELFNYPLSREVAHKQCVSFVNFDKMDAYISEAIALSAFEMKVATLT